MSTLGFKVKDFWYGALKFFVHQSHLKYEEIQVYCSYDINIVLEEGKDLETILRADDSIDGWENNYYEVERYVKQGWFVYSEFTFYQNICWGYGVK